MIASKLFTGSTQEILTFKFWMKVVGGRGVPGIPVDLIIKIVEKSPHPLTLCALIFIL